MGSIAQINRGNAVISYANAPWGNLGTTLDNSHSTESWMKTAGLDWDARKARNMFYDVEGNLHVAESNTIYRSDSNTELGTCADSYQIVQPFEIIDFYRKLVEERGWAIDVVGQIDGGKRIWAIAKTNGEISVKGTIDRMGMYLLLATSYDRSLATVATYTTYRALCSNMLRAVSKGNDGRVSVSHKTTFDADRVREKLGIAEEITLKMQEDMDILAERKVTDKEAEDFLIEIFAGKDVKKEDITTRKSNIITGVFDLYKGAGKGSNTAVAEGSAYGLLNAVTEYTSHHVGSRSDNNRFKAALFGAGDSMNEAAYKLAMKLAA